MCGRYYIEPEDKEELRDIVAEARAGGVPEGSTLKTGEVFPSDVAPVLIDGGGTKAVAMKWGFRRADGGLIINARSETAGEKPLFRSSARGRRCLVPASRYFEWRRLGTGKVKYAIRQSGQGVTYMGGLFLEDRRAGQPCFVILTRPAAESIGFIHDRMPLLVPRERLGDWLSPHADFEELLAFAREDVDYTAV